MRRYLFPVIFAVLLLGACGGSSSTSSSAPITGTVTASAPAGSWTPTTPVGSGTYSQLQYVQCNGRDDCSADGFGQVGTAFPQFLQHWDGASWTSSVSPFSANTTPISLGELDCLPDRLCVVPEAAQDPSIYGVSGGGQWTPLPTDHPNLSALNTAVPQESVNSVSCVSDTSCVAVGAGGGGTSASSLGLVWDGTIWTTTIMAPQGPDPIQHMVSVSCTSDTFCLGVGYTSTGPNDHGHTAIAARWDGTTWTAVPTPGGTRLDNVVCLSESSCILVGANGAAPLVEHWDGSSFVSEQTPFAGEVFSISCASEDLCMALQQPAADKPLGTVPPAIRWHGQWYEVTGYPAPAAFLSGAGCYDTGCVVVGWARSTPSSSASDISGAQTTAAFYDLTTGSDSSATPTASTIAPSTASSAASGSTAAHVVITGAVTATLTGQAQCFLEGTAHTAQLKGPDANGTDVTVTYTDANGGTGQVNWEHSLFAPPSTTGSVQASGNTVTFTSTAMRDDIGGTGKTIVVDGTMTCP
jgi:hypothetical protein